MVRPGHSPVFAPVSGASAASSATRSPALGERYPGVVTLPSLYPPSMPRRRGRRLDQDAGDVGVPSAVRGERLGDGLADVRGQVGQRELDRGAGLALGELGGARGQAALPDGDPERGPDHLRVAALVPSSAARNLPPARPGRSSTMTSPPASASAR